MTQTVREKRETVVREERGEKEIERYKRKDKERRREVGEREERELIV